MQGMSKWRWGAGALAMMAALLAGCGGGGGSKVNPSDTPTTPTAPVVVPASISYVSATPVLVYLAGSPGPNRADVVFRVLDAAGQPVANQQVRLQLANALLGTVLEGAAADGTVTATTDAQGQVVATVRAGTVPGAVRIAAALVATPAIATSSLELRLATGRPAQANTSLAASVLSIEAFNIDGAETTLTLSLADRQGNPVPDGVQVNFVAEGGAVFPSSCVVAGGQSRCSVVLRSQGTRPANGRVNILAYTPGEEDFTDLNGNNAWDAGEPFADMGDAFRDDNENRAWDAGEFQVRRGGSTVCTGTNFEEAPGRADTCDGWWGDAEVRRQIRIVFATSDALFGNLTRVTGPSGAFEVVVSDRLGNSLATGSVLSATVQTVDSASGCTIELATTVVPNGVQPTVMRFTAKDCQLGDRVTLTARSPSGILTSATYTLN